MKTDLLYLLEDIPDADHTADAQADQILRVKLVVDDLCGRKQALDRALPSDTELRVYMCRGVSPSLLSPEPWVNSSWYCLFGRLAGKTLYMKGLGQQEQKSQPKSRHIKGLLTFTKHTKLSDAPGVSYLIV